MSVAQTGQVFHCFVTLYLTWNFHAVFTLRQSFCLLLLLITQQQLWHILLLQMACSATNRPGLHLALYVKALRQSHWIAIGLLPSDSGSVPALNWAPKPASPTPAGPDYDRLATSAKPAAPAKPDPGQKVCPAGLLIQQAWRTL